MVKCTITFTKYLSIGLLLTSMLLFQSIALASTNNSITSEVTSGDNPNYNNVEIKLTNTGKEAADFQNAKIIFNSELPISSVWGSFGSLSYPTSIDTNTINRTVTIKLIFPKASWANTKLAPGASIKLNFGVNGVIDPSAMQNSIQVILNNQPPPPVKDGQIKLSYTSSDHQLSQVSVKVTGPNYNNRTVTIEHDQQKVLANLAYGSYTITAGAIGNYIPETTINTVNLSSTNKTVALQLHYQYKKPVKTTSAEVKLLVNNLDNTADLPAQTIILKHNGQVIQRPTLGFDKIETLNGLIVGDHYQVSVENKAFKYAGNQYTVLQPQDDFTALSGKVEKINFSYDQAALQKIGAMLDTTGLPANAKVSVTLTGSEDATHGLTLTKDLDNTGTGTLINVVPGDYTITATDYVDGNKTYVPTLKDSYNIQSGDTVTIGYAEKKPKVDKEFSPYIDVTLGAVTKWDPTAGTAGSMQPIGLNSIVKESGVKSLHLAFITAQGGCKATWAGYPVPDAETTDDSGYGIPVFRKLKQAGVHLTIALGGLSGTYLAQACDKDQLVNAYENIVKAYSPNELDFDVENNMQTNDADLDKMMQAINTIKSKYPNLAISFTLPVLPSGLVAGMGENVVDRAIINKVQKFLVNIMAMDYGPSFVKKSMGAYAIDAATSTKNQIQNLYRNHGQVLSDTDAWSRIGVTPMIGLNDTIPLNFSLADVDLLKQFGDAKGVGLLSLWSMTRDHSCNASYVSPSCSSNNPATGQPNQAKDWEYTEQFMK